MRRVPARVREHCKNYERPGIQSPSPGCAEWAIIPQVIQNLVLAVRNLVRQRRRSALAFAAVTFGVIALLLSGGFIEWVLWATREVAIQSQLGHIQVVRPGYHESGSADPLAYLLPEDAEMREAISGDPAVRVVTPRLAFNGLISHGDNTISFLGEGVMPDKEAEIGAAIRISQGDNLSAEDALGIILGEGLASQLGVVPDQQVVLLASTATGGLNAFEARVRGLSYTYNKARDDTALRVPLRVAQELLRVTGAHVWVVLLEDTGQTDAVLARLRAQYPPESGLQFVPWYELADVYNKTAALFSRQMNFVKLIIGLIIIFSITNTLSMSVMERTGEIGTLLAIGTRRRQIKQLFFTEGVLLGLVGGMSGVLMGILLAYAISAIGIPMPPPPGMEHGYTGRILVNASLVGGVFLLALGTAALASLYPASKASRLQIVDALRHNR